MSLNALGIIITILFLKKHLSFITGITINRLICLINEIRNDGLNAVFDVRVALLFY